MNKKDILSVHETISGMAMPVSYRAALHRALGEQVELDRPWWAAYGWGERRNCLSLRGQEGSLSFDNDNKEK